MRFGSVCSGIEAASVAWHPLGWEAAWFSEIEPFPCQVLKHHYPNVPNYGDMTKFKDWPDEPIDLLCGGTPCQSFSVAGLRKGLDDPRGNLMLTFGAIAAKFRPTWLVWENVPGVLSSNGGRDFGTFLGMLGQLGYGYAYRILDAQHFGVPQRRRRVFVVGCLGDWRRAAAVLFERHSLSGDIAPRRKTGEGVTRAAQPSTPSSWWDGGSIAATLTTKSDDQRMPDKDNAQLILQSVPFRDPSPTITARMQGSSGWAPYNEDAHLIGVAQPIAIQDVRGMDKAQNGKGWSEDGTAYTLDAIESVGTVFQAMQVRRLTPTECERLQGFPDGYTAIPWRNKPAEECPDGPRYKALGNSWAVPVVRWIGERINAVQEIKVAA